MDKEDREYLRLLIRERLRGIVEIPPDNILNEIIKDLWDEFLVIQDKDRWMKKV
jgi:hypothetical protein